MRRDYYEVLGVSRECSPADIQHAFRRLARRYHPDVCKEPDADERFKEIGEAYRVLSDPARRGRYDRFGHDGDQAFAAPTGFGDVFDLIEQVFGRGFADWGTAEGPSYGRDLQYEVTIDLAGVLTGVDTDLEVTRQTECQRCNGSGAEPGTTPETCRACRGTGRVTQYRRTILGVMTSQGPCPECHGRGTVIHTPCSECSGTGVVQASQAVHIHIPPGISDGQGIVLPGQGDMPAGGGVPGDLHIRVRVEPHEVFERRDRSLIMQLEVSFTQAALGDRVTVPTIDGEAQVTIPPGTQTGDRVHLRGQGLPALRGGARGDQIVILRVVTPTDLDDEQRRLLLELAARRGEDIDPQAADKSLFDRLREAFTSS